MYSQTDLRSGMYYILYMVINLSFNLDSLPIYIDKPALKYLSDTEIVRHIREIVRRREPEIKKIRTFCPTSAKLKL